MAARHAADMHQLPSHARVWTTSSEYVVELDVTGFTIGELTVEAVGPLVTVRGDHRDSDADRGIPFRIREHLDETFRLPDDVKLDSLSACCKHGMLELRAPREPLQRRSIPIARHHGALIHPDAVGV